jgi:hypothetical protein
LVTVIPDAALDADGLKEGSAVSSALPTTLYAVDALPIIDAADDDGTLGDCSLLHDIVQPAQADFTIDVQRVGPEAVMVTLAGTARTGVGFPGLGAPCAINWQISINVDATGAKPVVATSGEHDGFPAYEMYVNQEPVYQRMPDVGGPPYGVGQLFGDLCPPLDVGFETIHVLQNQTVTLQKPVPPGLASLTLSTLWPGSDIVLTLVSPTGRIIDRDTSAGDVEHQLTPTSEEYTLLTPEAGLWELRLFGADVPAAGHDVQLSASYDDADSDDDGTLDPTDNCISVPNSDQTDFDGNGLGDQCDDGDLDGCTDAEERSLNPVNGGLRNSNEFHDFFDTPDANNRRDRVITVADISRVVSRFSSTGSSTIDPLSTPPPAPAFHTAFDRTHPTGSAAWLSGPPDGVISIVDVGLVVGQFGHTCAV